MTPAQTEFEKQYVDKLQHVRIMWVSPILDNILSGRIEFLDTGEVYDIEISLPNTED